MKAGERARTVDIQLGKLTLYQLSYTRGEIVILAGRGRASMVEEGLSRSLFQIADSESGWGPNSQWM